MFAQSGRGYSYAATIDDDIVIVLATILQYPNTETVNIVGINQTIDMQQMLKAADIPNLAIIMKTKMKSSNCQNTNSNTLPIIQIKKQMLNPYLAPAKLYILLLTIFANTSAN